jgi:arylsulfatase/arylsulfatase A
MGLAMALHDLLFVLPLAGSAAAAQEAARPPNLVVVMTDDQGAGDLGCAGNPVLDTPSLDALAAAGARFERFYVSPVCAPTRASLMTGRWTYRTRVVDTWIGRAMMEPAEVTVAEVLQGAGYRTGIFGKWHLGDCYPLRPIDQGFDTALVHRGGGLAQPSEPPESARRYTDPVLFRDGEPVQAEGYCTQVYFDAALEFIDASVEAGRPFFAYVATNAPHDPLHDVPEELYGKYAGRDLSPVLLGNDGDADRVARIYAMVEDIDRNVGRLLAHLDARGLADDTLVVFLCDNGPQTRRYVGSMRGRKGEVHEGGIRSPLFVRWPGRIEPGTRVGAIGAHVDLFPTLLAAAGVPVPDEVRPDGRSLLPLLTGQEVEWPERLLFIQAHRGDVPVRGNHFAVIGPRWKLVRPTGFGRETPTDEVPLELYDLVADPFERDDLAAERPEVVARLSDAYAAWFEDVSTTRPDNWAPPRIVVGTAHERTTVLTKQDWRDVSGPGWGTRGTWRLRTRAPCELEVTLVFREETAVGEVTLDLSGDVRTFQADRSGHAIPLGKQRFPQGDVDLRVACELEGGLTAPHQVVLDSR